MAEVEPATLVLVGAETHICIAQTALQAMERGIDAVIVADAVTARGRLDHDIALRRLERAGVRITTWEALAYEWMRSARHPAFKQVLPIVKG